MRGLGVVSTGVAFGGGRIFGQETLSPEALYAKHVPADKGLDPKWVESLYKRGHEFDAAIAHDGEEVDLEVIGMPVGGIGCGTVYLSGDGRLWICFPLTMKRQLLALSYDQADRIEFACALA